MAQKPPLIAGHTFIDQQQGQPAQLELGTAAWYAWLDTASSFLFRCDEGSFTARKEQAGNKRGGLYWRAYRKQDGTLRRMYLGKGEELTLERLKAVAALLVSSHADDVPRLQEPLPAGQNNHGTGQGQGYRTGASPVPTNNAHLTTIYRKIQVNTRSAATRYALANILL